MAFVLLAAGARDDTLLFLQEQEKRRKELARFRPSPRSLQQEEKKESDHHDDDEDSCHSLPSNWMSAHRSRPHHHHHHHHHHHTSNKAPFTPFSSLKSYFTLSSSRRSNSSKLLRNHDDLSTWRQRRRVRQAAKDIQTAVEARLQKAPFLASCRKQQEDDNSTLPSPDDDDDDDARESEASDLPLVPRDEITIRYWLGRGGFCDVYEVEPVAVYAEESATKAVFKHLRSTLLPHHPSIFANSLPGTSDFVLGAIDLRMEALYLSQISHPNIIDLIGVVQPQRGLPYSDGHYDGFGLLLEPLSDTLDLRLENWKREVSSRRFDHDESFRSVVDSNWYPSRSHLEKAVNYAAQIADALSYLHERRLLLCDMKPSNVGLTKDDTVKLFDFGLCKELPAIDPDDDDAHRLYTLPVAGTHIYLPPEVLIQRKYNCLIDVYSWAMVLYELLSLCRPFEDLSREELYQRVAKGGERPPLHKGKVPSELHCLLQHAWDADVTQRWTMQQIQKELNNVRRDMGLLKTQQEQKRQPPRPTYLRRKSSMDSLLNGRCAVAEDKRDAVDEDDDDLESLDDDEEEVGMTAEDFESYFAEYHHHLSSKTTWKAALPVCEL